ncbi:hypothetical protein MLD38_032728 [Melastoma candidum]|uniref:Uncharacterized protein n=1 Tax=Melastoma candidum TaxID=119954 RepID=A0ACB9M530_9MYRT|nr:hypothetical protein MLD38_032728 [Melastoma candidum]
MSSVANHWVTAQAVPLSQPKHVLPFLPAALDCSAPKKSSAGRVDCFQLGSRISGGSIAGSAFRGRRSPALGFRCGKGVGVGAEGSGVSCSEWDWNKWSRHFAEIEQAENFASVLKFQLEEAIEKEDFHEAAKLKLEITEAASKDTVSEIMSQLKHAVEEERYHDASRLCKYTGSGLVGWWVGYSKVANDPFGRLVRITPSVGRFVGRSYSPRQLVTGSSGTPLFEIFVVRDGDGTYTMQVVYLHRNKAPLSSGLKSPKGSPAVKLDEPLAVDEPDSDVPAEASDEKGLNIEGATEEGIKSVINFLKDKIPGLKVKVMNVNVAEEVVEENDSVKQLMQEDVDEEVISVSDSDEEDNLEQTHPDDISLSEDGSIKDNDKDLEMKLFIGGVVHNEDPPSKDEYVRRSAEIKNIERDSFLLHIPSQSLGHDSENNHLSKVKMAAMAAQGVSELMPPDVAKAFLVADKVSPKVSRNVREIVKLAVTQAEKRSRLSEFTSFSRITTPKGDLDPFDGLYVGAFGPYGTEVVQLRRKFGHWNSGSTEDNQSGVEFFEYVEAVKLTGDLNVPAGQVTFRAKIGKGGRTSNRGMFPDELGVVASYKGQGRIAEFGFRNPKWVEGELLQLNGKGMGQYLKGADLGFLYVVPEQSFLVLFNRLRLPE